MSKKKGRFDKSEEAFIRQNFLSMSDKDLADAINRDRNSIIQYRKRNNLNKQGSKVTKKSNTDNDMKKKAFVNSMSDGEKKRVFLDELRATAQYRTTIKSIDDLEKQFYEERYLEFMMDPTVETMTASEKDTLHRKTISEIRMIRYLEDEKNFRDTGSQASRSREIQECQDTIYKCEKSLNVTREQRLKDNQDQSITFTNIIKELQDPNKRSEIGYEAAMLKYMAELHYEKNIGLTIYAGDDSTVNVDENFVNGKKPEQFTEDFLGRNNGKEK